MSTDNKIQPVLREDKAYELKNYIYKMVTEYRGEVTRSCISCSLFKESTETCTKFNARPPARVIAYGCKDYFSEDEIPF